MASIAVEDDELDNSTEFYAEIILTCRGQFDDPCLDSRLDDITNQLHTLSKDNNRPLVVDVRPWNSVRVTLKVSRDTAAALQRLAQRRDPKLVDIGILSVQVDGGSVLHLNRDQEMTIEESCGIRSETQNSTSNGIVSSLTVGGRHLENTAESKSHEHGTKSSSCSSSSCMPATFTEPSQLEITSHIVSVSRSSSSLSSSKATVAPSCRDSAWHPLEGRQTSASANVPPINDSSSGFWNQMSNDWRHNGLNTDPFQFSADDLLTRMLADVPTPKRRHKLRKGSTASDLFRFDMYSAAQSSAVAKQSDASCYSLLHSAAGDVKSKQYSVAENPHTNFELGWSPCSTNSGDVKDIKVLSAGDYRLPSGRLYSEKSSNDSKAFLLSACQGTSPKDNDLLSNSSPCISSSQPNKRRRLNARGGRVDIPDELGNSNSITSMDSLYAEPFAAQRIAASQGMGSCRISRPSSFGSSPMMGCRVSEHLPSRLQRPTSVGDHSVNELQNVHRHSPRSATSYSRMRHGLAKQAGLMEFSPYLLANSASSSSVVSASANTHYHSVESVNKIPCYSSPSAIFSSSSRLEMPAAVGRSVPSQNIYAASSVAVCTADVCNRVPSYLPLSSTMTVPSSVVRCSSPRNTSGIVQLVRPDAGSSLLPVSTLELLHDKNPACSYPLSTTACTASPHETWTSGELDYFGACGADSGIASNTSLSVGSDHSETDRASTETTPAELSCVIKRSPLADNPVTSPLAAECSNRPLATNVGLMSDGASSPSSTQGSWADMAAFSSNRHSSDCAFTNNSQASESIRIEARQRFIRKSRQTPAVVSEFPPAITCPSLPRRLSESVKRAMRGGGELPNPPMVSPSSDIGPAKVVIRITKTRCNGGNEAKRSKHKEQWSVQPILKPLIQSAESSLEISDVPVQVPNAADPTYHSNQLRDKQTHFSEIPYTGYLGHTDCSQTECPTVLAIPMVDNISGASATTQLLENTPCTSSAAKHVIGIYGIQQEICTSESTNLLDRGASD